MQINVNNLIGYVIGATDGELGKVDDLYFDDTHYAIRYLIVDTSEWMESRMVLISPLGIKNLDQNSKKIFLNLNKEQVRNSPDIDTDKPVSRQHEVELFKHYAWPAYWGDEFYPGGIYGMDSLLPNIDGNNNEEVVPLGDPHLQSTKQITNYYIQAIDGEIGHVEDFILDNETWKIKYLVVNTRNWIPGKKVLISPNRIKEINWADEKVMLDLEKEIIKNSSKID